MTLGRLLGLDVERLRRRGATVVVGLVVAAVAALAAVHWGLDAAQRMLARRFDSEIASAIVAGGALVTALLAATVALVAWRRCRRQLNRAVTHGAVATLAPPAVSAVLRDRRVAAMVVSVGVGWLIARTLRDR